MPVSLYLTYREFHLTCHFLGGNEHLPSYIKKADDTSLSPVEVILKSNVVSGDYSEEPLLKKDIHLKHTEGRRALTVHVRFMF